MKREREKGLVNLISTDQRRGNNKPTLGINRWIISVIYYNFPFIPPHSPVRAFVRSEASSCSFRGEESRLFLRFRRANFINFLTPESRLIPRHALFAHARVGFLGRGRSIPRYDDIIVSTLAYYKRVTIAVLASLSSPAGMPSPRRGFNCPRGEGDGRSSGGLGADGRRRRPPASGDERFPGRSMETSPAADNAARRETLLEREDDDGGNSYPARITRSSATVYKGFPPTGFKTDLGLVPVADHFASH